MTDFEEMPEMIRSMTGFGRAQASLNGFPLQVELKSVNNRFKDVALRLPRSLSTLEGEVREFLQSRFARGSITATLTWEESSSLDLREVDRQVAAHYYRLLRQLKTQFGLAGDVDLGLLATFPDVFRTRERGGRKEAALRVLLPALGRAAADLERMRRREGKHLNREMRTRTRKLGTMVGWIRRTSPRRVNGAQRRLERRVARLTGSLPPDPQRLASEIALLADRCDVSEECSRLLSHLAQFRDYLGSRDPVGRRLDFLLQEMNREANTLGAKVQDAKAAQVVVAMKEEIEKLREQVQNVE
jgi:uncharacterized protein (TIGR00255 family)